MSRASISLAELTQEGRWQQCLQERCNHLWLQSESANRLADDAFGCQEAGQRDDTLLQGSRSVLMLKPEQSGLGDVFYARVPCDQHQFNQREWH